MHDSVNPDTRPADAMPDARIVTVEAVITPTPEHGFRCD